MPKRGRVRRFSVSLPPTLVEELDEIWKSMHYSSRSKAVHDAIRNFITDYRWMHEDMGQIIGAIVMVYYLNRRGLLDELMNIQHKFKGVISSAMHTHLEENKCLEIIAVKGSVAEIKNLTQELMARKGVKQVKFAAITS